MPNRDNARPRPLETDPIVATEYDADPFSQSLSDLIREEANLLLELRGSNSRRAHKICHLASVRAALLRGGTA